jgi:hypothetical protein
MTREQRNKLNMYLSIRNLITMFIGIIKKIPKFESAYAVLQNLTDQIQQVSELQGINKTGLAMDKNKLRKKLIDMTVKYSNKLSILAKSLNNDTMLKEVRLSPSSLNLAGVTLRDKARVIYDKVEANISNLQDQEINADTQEKFLEVITAFNNALSTPRTGIAERRQSTQKLSSLFDAADDAIEILDLAMGSVKDEQPDFYNSYRSARKIVDINTGRVTLRGSAVDLISKEPLKGVIFSFRHGSKTTGSNGNGEIVKKTAEKGSFRIRNMEAGTYSVLISKSGYKDKDISLDISDSERNEVKVELEKA